MGLLHFHFSFFLGGPDGLQERFSLMWEAFGSLLGALGVSLGSFGRTLSALWRPLGDHFGLLGLRLAPLLLSWHAFGYDFGDPGQNQEKHNHSNLS